MNDSALSAFVMAQAWALHPAVLKSAMAIVTARVEGRRAAPDEVDAVRRMRDARVAERRAAWSLDQIQADSIETRGYFMDGAVAVVPLSGVICKYADMINGVSQPMGMTSAQAASAISRAASDPAARAGLLLEIDSPGGTVFGVSDVLGAIDDASAMGRPVVGFAHDQAASAAYWIASRCDEVFLTETAEVGSIGVYCVVEDTSAMLESAGIRRYLIASGAHKGAGADGVSVTADHLDALGATVAAHFGTFIRDVRSSRDLDDDRAAQVSTGRVYVGADAVRVGLADGVAQYQAVVDAMNRRSKGSRV